MKNSFSEENCKLIKKFIKIKDNRGIFTSDISLRPCLIINTYLSCKCPLKMNGYAELLSCLNDGKCIVQNMYLINVS